MISPLIELFETRFTVGEFPMTGRRVWLQQSHAVDHPDRDWN